MGRGSGVDSTASDGQRHRTTLAELGRVLREGAAQAESAGRLDQTVLAGRHRLPSVDRPDLLVDDCRALGVPDPDSNGAVGALFIAACKAGVIQPVGLVQSRRRSRHASWQRRWVEGAAA